jgi:ABC-type transport system involved in cytochrome c biogenesis permease subunit
MNTALLHGSIAFFAVAAALGIAGVRADRRGLFAAARAATLLGAAALALLFVRRGIETGSFPISSRFESLLFTTALFAALAVAIDLLRGMPVLTIGAAPMAVLTLLLAVTMGAPPHGTAAPASAWVGVHVLLTLAAYGLFGLAFIAAILYLVEQRQLKSGAAGAGLLGIMPSLETFYRILVSSLLLGVAFLTAGFLLGYLYARRALPAGWRTDPKIILTTATWAAYVLVAVLAFLPATKGRRTALASAGCFVLVMAALWASSFWTGFHRFA